MIIALRYLRPINKKKSFSLGTWVLYKSKILRQNSAAQFMNKTMEEAFVIINKFQIRIIASFNLRFK